MAGTCPQAKSTPWPLAAAMPSLLIGEDGRVQEVLGLGRLAEALVADSPEAKRADLRRALAPPKLRHSKAGEDWNGWVGVWLGREVPAGGRLALTATTEVLGAQVQSRGSIADLGRVEGDPAGAIRFVSKLTADGPDLARAVFGALERIAPGPRQPLGSLGLDKVESASRRDLVVLVADRSALDPTGPPTPERLAARRGGSAPVGDRVLPLRLALSPLWRQLSETRPDCLPIEAAPVFGRIRAQLLRRGRRDVLER